VKVQDLYDEFNYGIFNPQAIRDFLTYAYQNWQAPAPLYVLLVGDAYQDYKDNLNSASINFVPSQIVEGLALGETVSDNWFVQIAGDDVLPDMYIGRLSAQSAPQVNTIIQKVMHYEQNEDPSSWSWDALFVADDDDPAFETYSDRFANLLPGFYTKRKIYVADYPPGNPTQDIYESLNSGSLMVNYLGHGGIHQWGIWGDPPANILDNNSVSLMTNSDKLPFVTIETCLNGFFTSRQTNYSLAEALQRHGNGGAVAVWAPSGMGLSGMHEQLIIELYKVFYPAQVYGLGQATTTAKWNIYDLSSMYGDLVRTYIFFGDPATVLGAEFINFEHQIFLPLTLKTP
jgi:hypothetical protein